ncbi:MAG: hypothetical protein HS108_15640 [Planctomycetes bacterium]|jgi:hypothetical protein|nr:hypothetical protein [Planctomycetota bacterium]MCL4731845.1 hypothetical protein [Planctomycetota bacterium]
MRPDPWVAIEITRRMRLEGGTLADPGALSVAGVNLLEHQIAVARRVAPAARVVLLAPQTDETLLEIAGRHELREMSPLDFVAAMRERAAEGAPVVLLRQCVPLRDARGIMEALDLLAAHPVVVSASRSPQGHLRLQPPPGETGPDLRCLAFEARRASEFAGGLSPEHLLFVPWDSFAEYLGPRDEPEVAARLRSWGLGRQEPGPGRPA